MGRVATALAAEAHGWIAPVVRRLIGSVLFAFEATERRPRLDQGKLTGDRVIQYVARP